jgi:8-oxo-dGTP diphosphatase
MEQAAINIKVVPFSIIENSVRVFAAHNKLPCDEPKLYEEVEETVKRVINEFTGISLKSEFIDQLYTYINTVKEKRIITVVFYVLIPNHQINSQKKANWKIPEKIAPDSADYSVINYATQRLQWKLEYTNVVYSLLPTEFTLRDLQLAYEAILRKQLDKRNFQKKILSLRLIKKTKHIQSGNQSRPARLYSFIKHSPVITNIFS